MKQLVVDTNAFLRFLLDDIPEQKNAFEKLLKQAKKSEIVIYVPQIIIFELHFILDKYYHFTKEEIIDKLKPIVSVSYLQVEKKEVFLSALTMYTGNTNVSFVDCFLVAQAKQLEADLFTFDEKLQKLS